MQEVNVPDGDKEKLIRSLVAQIGNQAAQHAIEIANRDLDLVRMQEEVQGLRQTLDSVVKEMMSAQQQRNDEAMAGRVHTGGEEAGEASETRPTLTAVSSNGPDPSGDEAEG
jgi:hypothetical protein